MNKIILLIFLLFCCVSEAEVVVKKAEFDQIKIVNSPEVYIKRKKIEVPFIQKTTLDSLRASELSGKIYKNVDIQGRIAKIKGWIKQPVNSAWLQIGDAKQPISLLQDGSFEQPVILTNGLNDISLIIGGIAVDSIEISPENLPSTPLRIVLMWMADHCDLDLYVSLPQNEGCIWFRNMENHYGHLDIDDTDGFGPEHFSLTAELQGTYEIYCQYYDSHGFEGPISFRVDVYRYDALIGSYMNQLGNASRWEAGPGNAGKYSSWKHIADVRLP